MSCKVDITCAHCGKVFSLYRSQMARNRGRFCSVTCGVRARGGTSELRPCAVCGREFRARGSSIAKGHGLTCSPKCSHRFVAAKAAHPARLRSCHRCGRRFHAKARPSQPRRFCSRECFSAWNQGERRFNWKGGITSDTAAYKREAAAKRRSITMGLAFCPGVSKVEWREICSVFGHRCPSCGRHEREIGRLTMDHIIPLSKGGIHQPGNVQPLCGRCNSKKNTRIVAFDPSGAGFELVDGGAFLGAIVSGAVPLDAIELNWGYLDHLAARHKDALAVPGIEAYAAEV